MESLFVFFYFWIFPLFSLIVGCCIIYAAMRVKDVMKSLDSQQESLERQEKILIAQLPLLASISNRVKVPIEDINDIGKEFGVEYK